jgi:hypothetical protein
MGRGLLQAPAALPAGPRPHSARLPVNRRRRAALPEAACQGWARCGAQGHLRLVLAPIVYNAMAQKACLRALPLFRALCRVLRASTYDPLLHHPPPHALPQVVGRCCPNPSPIFFRHCKVPAPSCAWAVPAMHGILWALPAAGGLLRWQRGQKRYQLSVSRGA